MMTLRLSVASRARSVARWSRRLGVVAVLAVAGVAAAPALSYAPVASVAVPNHQGAEDDGGPADPVVRASITPAVAGPSVVDDVPAPALRAYRFAVSVLDRTDPACGLGWSLLAAIGDVESDHGRYGGSVLLADGTSSPPLLGPRLDGDGEVAAIADTDDGSLDGDQRWVRAVGPMQFIPSTWAVVGSDADGDDVRDPGDIDDAALSAAAYLCAGRGDLSTLEGQLTAVLRYNPSRAYVDLVLRLAAAYAQQRVGPGLPTPRPREGGVQVPTLLTATLDLPAAHPAASPRADAAATASAVFSDATAAADTSKGGTAQASSRQQHVGSDRSGSTHTTRTSGGTGGSRTTNTGAGTTSGGTSGGGASGGSTTSGGTDGTTGGGTTSGGTGDGTSGGGTSDGGDTSDGGSAGGTDEQPPPPVSGTLQRTDDGTWSVGGNTVDFGDDAYLSNTALNDFDGADGVESNLAELETLLGHDVIVALEQSGQVVVRLNDLAYRGAPDGASAG